VLAPAVSVAVSFRTSPTSPESGLGVVEIPGTALPTENGSQALGGELLWFGSLPAT